MKPPHECKRCHAQAGAIVRRSKFSERVWIALTRPAPESQFLTSSEVVMLGDDGLCLSCKRATEASA